MTTKKKKTTHTTHTTTKSGTNSLVDELRRALGADGATDDGTLYGLPAQLAGQKVITRVVPGTQYGMGTTTETATFLQEVKDLYQLSPAELNKLQQQLYDGHFYDESYYSKNGRAKINSKYADDATRGALINALIDASRSGKSLPDLLSTAAMGAPPADAAAGQPFSYVAPDPADVEAALKQQFTSIIGHGVSDQQMSQLVAAYEKATVTAARSAYDANLSGGVTHAAPDIKTFAQQEAEKLYPTDEHAKRLANLSSEFVSAIQGFTQADRTY